MDIKEKLTTLPLSPGVYIMKDRFGNVTGYFWYYKDSVVEIPHFFLFL